jgi:hypothetical protein
MRGRQGGWVLALLCACGTDASNAEDTDTDAATVGESSSSPTSASQGATTQTPASTSTTTDPGTTGTSSPDPTSADESSSGSSSTGGEEGPDVDVSDPQLYEFEIDPTAIDPEAMDYVETQFAHLDTRAEPLGKLVFFLSGYTNTPSAWRNHGRHLASYGFHVVEPHYHNSWSCDDTPNCNEDSRWEALTGEDVSSVIVVSRADSAEGRVVAMLEWLDVEHPGGDWGYYLDGDGNLRTEHVIIAGISHGASSTGLYASRRPCHRAVMHSGTWWNVGENPATPIDGFYSLSHRDDPQHAGHLDAWDGAGLLGENVVIEESAPPYGDSRRLIATTPNGYPHCSVVVHGESPMIDEAYVFDPAWRVMYGAPL